MLLLLKKVKDQVILTSIVSMISARATTPASAAPFPTPLAKVSMSGTVSLAGEDMPRLGWIVGISLLYISLFFTLGLMISAFTHRAATSLIISLFVWICWILVIPNLAPVIARIAYAVPSIEKIAAEKLAVDKETEIRLQRVSQTMLIYGNEAQQKQDEIREEGERRKDKLDRFYEDELGVQIGVSQTLSRLSPAASTRPESLATRMVNWVLGASRRSVCRPVAGSQLRRVPS